MDNPQANYDRKINNWQVVSYTHEGEQYRFVRGIILEDRKGDFERGNWVCSTRVFSENNDENILITNNTIYKLQGSGEHHIAESVKVFTYLRQGLTFQQAMWAIEKES